MSLLETMGAPTYDRKKIAKVLSNPKRAAIIEILAEGAQNVSSLVLKTRMSQPEVSLHLSALLSAGMVESRRTGKVVNYALIPEPLERYSNWLEQLSSARSIKTTSKFQDDGLKETPDFSLARTCYDHLAGRYGVELLETLLGKSWLMVEDPSKPTYKLTDLGIVGMERLGITIPLYKSQGRIFAFGCRDVSEKKLHLGGLLGALILRDMIRRKIVAVISGTRILRVHGTIIEWFIPP